MNEPDLPALIGEYIPEELHDDLELAMRTALRLRPAADDDDTIGYFGGVPELPEGTTWPGDGHEYYEHVATIDLAALPPLDLELPDDGTFVAFGHSLGWSGALLYVPRDARTYRPAPPPGLLDAGLVHDRVPMSYTPIRTLPPMHWIEDHLLHDHDYDDRVYDRLEAFGDLAFLRHGPCHQLGGWATEIQRDNDRGILPGSGAEELFHPDGPPDGKILLAQFDTDLDRGLGWGDFGMLYHFIAPEEFTAGTFDDIETYWDCY
ncbi:DUF1963 domain-containing protein [Nocardia testacea]|uniref:DUF1963 domain-containing protein n=1 Tax=Nocardia testacea TaxID=248551 RepID=UPI003C2D8D61